MYGLFFIRNGPISLEFKKQTPLEKNLKMNETIVEIVELLKTLSTQINEVRSRLDELDVRMVSLGKSNSKAFEMCKTTISALAENQESVYSELMEAAGKIQTCSWS